MHIHAYFIDRITIEQGICASSPPPLTQISRPVARLSSSTKFAAFSRMIVTFGSAAGLSDREKT
jgi:hypothetical protein